MKIGEVIRSIRLENGATLEDIAFSADTDAGNLSRIERGRQRYRRKSWRGLQQPWGFQFRSCTSARKQANR